MNILNLIRRNLLIKVTSANILLVGSRMIFSLITQKVFALFIGAEGIAFVGYMRNVIHFFENFSILGTANGLVKYISEYRKDKVQLNNLFSTLFLFACIASSLSFIILFFGSNFLSQILFGGKTDYHYVFKILSFVIPFISLNAIINSLLNGLSEYKLYSKITLSTIVISTIFIVYATISYGVYGVLVVLSIIPVIQVLISFFYLKSLKNLLDIQRLNFNFSFKNRLTSYFIMSMSVILFINITDIAIRNLIETKVGIEDAGYWTAITSISKSYMQFIAAIFPLYVLPSYAKISSSKIFRKEVFKIYKLLLPLLVVGLLLVYLFRSTIIRILYTSQFMEMEVLFKWQLLGDLVKFIAIVIAYQFLAKREIVNYIFTELLSLLLFYVFSLYFIEIYNTEGIVMAHFFRYVIYLLVVFYLLRRHFIGVIKE